MVSTDICLNPVIWSTIGDRNNVSTDLTIYFYKGSVHYGVFSKQRLFLSELPSSESLFLVAPHVLWVVAWVVRQHKRESCLSIYFLAVIVSESCTFRPPPRVDAKVAKFPLIIWCIYSSVFILSVLCWSLEGWASGNPRGISQRCLLPPSFCLTLLLGLTAGFSFGTTRLICYRIDVDQPTPLAYWVISWLDKFMSTISWYG